MERDEAPLGYLHAKNCVVNVSSGEEKMMTRLVFWTDRCTGDDCQLSVTFQFCENFHTQVETSKTQCRLFCPIAVVVFQPESLSLGQAFRCSSGKCYRQVRIKGASIL